MRTKKQLFDELTGGTLPSRTLFRPILMHPADCFGGTIYGIFASDYKIPVDCNIRSMEYFGTDMTGLISDSCRETSAFGAKLTFSAEDVPRLENILVKTLQEV